MIIGYARVSTKEQNLDRQLDMLKAQGCERIYHDKVSGTRSSRPQFDIMLAILRSGDILIVESFSRLSRSTKDLLELVDKLKLLGVELKSLKENLDTTTATGKLMLSMMSAISQFERDLIAERTQEGVASARLRGRVGGRPPVGTYNGKKAALALYAANTLSNRQIAEQAGVSQSTLSRWIREAKQEGKL